MITKVVAGVAGTSLLTSVGVGSYFYATTPYPSIKKLLASEKSSKTVLNSSITDKNSWTSQWTSYVENAEENIWELGRWTEIKSHKNVVPDEFTRACEERIQDTVIDKKDTKYVNFLKWCTK